MRANIRVLFQLNVGGPCPTVKCDFRTTGLNVWGPCPTVKYDFRTTGLNVLGPVLFQKNLKFELQDYI